MPSNHQKKSDARKDKPLTGITSNWLNIITLVIASISLWLSFQANLLTKQNSSPFIKIVSEAFETETMMILGCQNDNSYYVSYYVGNEYTFSNMGGRAVSLIKVSLNRGNDKYKVKVYTPQSFDSRRLEAFPDLDIYHGLVFSEGFGTSLIVPTKAEPIDLPLNIDSGNGEKWLFQGDKFDIFKDEKEARQAITNARDGKNIFSWEFVFSDGTVVKNDKFIVSYSYSDTSTNFPPCESK